MKEFCTKHPLLLTSIIAITAGLYFLIFFKQYDLQDFLTARLFTILSVTSGFCIALNRLMANQICKEERNQRPNPNTIYWYRRTKIFSPIFIILVLILTFPFLTKTRASTKYRSNEIAQKLIVLIENNTSRLLPGYIYDGINNQSLNKENILSLLSENNSNLADSLLANLEDSLEKPDINYIRKTLDTTLISIRPHIEQEVSEILLLTTDLKAVIDAKNPQNIDALLRKYHIRTNVTAFEYINNLEGPARDIHSLRNFLRDMMDEHEDKREFRAILKLDRGNNLVHILTNNQ